MYVCSSFLEGGARRLAIVRYVDVDVKDCVYTSRVWNADVCSSRRMTRAILSEKLILTTCAAVRTEVCATHTTLKTAT